MKIILVFVNTVLLIAPTTAPDFEDGANHSSAVDSLRITTYTRHAFYRDMDEKSVEGAGVRGESRRVFGGEAVQLEEFPAVCALLDRYWAVRCSGTLLRAHWALTAAHCVTPSVAYVKYNTRSPAAAASGNVTAVHYLYRHPDYRVEQKDEGRGMDVTALQHDVGLVRTRDPMLLASARDVPGRLLFRNPSDLWGKEVQVLGFGRTERSVLGEELFAVRLRLVGCERAQWVACVCGVAREPRGVCSGDSGGPVLYEGAPVGVTSMGPVQCAGSAPPPAGASSVFTALHRYAALISATMADADSALRMRVIAAAAARPRLLSCAFYIVIFMCY